MRAAVLLLVAACTPFDAATPEAPEGGATPPATGGSPPPAMGLAPTVPGCAGEPLLIGSDTIPQPPNGANIGDNYMDAYGFKASRTAVASCAFLYLDRTPGPGTLRIAIYGDEGMTPGARRATATIMKPLAGWNGAKLDTDLSVLRDSTMWIAVASTTFLDIRSKNCSTALRLRFVRTDGMVPDPFPPSHEAGDMCDAAMFLTP
jgi:hypothetical protein